LNDLTKKDTPFALKEAQQTAFDTLKNRFTTAPILAYPDNDRVFRLETDASNFATGAVLSIEQHGKWHPVAFSSHSMSPEERNYPVADKEMLSVIRSLEQWRHYLEGAHHEFEIWNDHANLQWFMKHQISTADKPDGPNTLAGSTSNGSTKPAQPWVKQMSYLGEKTTQ
jgi:hypothetical protein